MAFYLTPLHSLPIQKRIFVLLWFVSRIANMLTVLQIENISKCKNKLHMIRPENTAVEAAQAMSLHRVSCLLVQNADGHIAGIMTERDLVGKVIALQADPQTTLVSEIMTARVIACEADTLLQRAQKIMAENGIRHLPIVNNRKPVAMLSSRDLMEHQITSMHAVVQKQSQLLNDLEIHHPGISQLVRDEQGRIVI